MKPIQPVWFDTAVCGGVGKFPAGVASRHGTVPTLFTCATPDGGIRRAEGPVDAAWGVRIFRGRKKIPSLRHNQGTSWTQQCQVGPSSRELTEFFPRLWDTVAALFARVQLFCIVAFRWARGNPAQSHRELRQWGQSAPPQSWCVQSPQRWLVGHLGRLATYLRGGVVVRQTRRMATWHYIGYFNIRMFRA